jgi:hypothetical protein
MKLSWIRKNKKTRHDPLCPEVDCICYQLNIQREIMWIEKLENENERKRKLAIKLLEDNQVKS